MYEDEMKQETVQMPWSAVVVRRAVMVAKKLKMTRLKQLVADLLNDDDSIDFKKDKHSVGTCVQGRTRWNSHVRTLRRLLSLRRQIDALCNGDGPTVLTTSSA